MKSVPDAEFIRVWERERSPVGVARALGYSDVRPVYTRRNRLAKNGVVLSTGLIDFAARHKARRHIKVPSGVVLVGSDAHYWFRATCAHRAFVHFCRELQPEAVIMNGDVFDGARLSRFDRIGFMEHAPSVAEELDCCKERLGEIRDAAPNAKHHWTLGNHDIRFEGYLAKHATEMEGVTGAHLKDHFPDWVPSWSVHINRKVAVKHRWKGGIHAPHNNTKESGMSMVTGHLHSARVCPWTDYGDTRYGVDSGMLADVGDSNSVHYTEDAPVNWRSAFAVLTFHEGKLLMPELAMKYDEAHVQFRGQLIEV